MKKLRYLKTESGGTKSLGHITIEDAKNIKLNTTTGTKIGTAATQKIGFLGATPVVQGTAYTQTYSTGNKTVANPTATAIGDLGSTTTTPWGYDSEAHADSVHTAIDALIADNLDLRQAITSLIDDLQALGLVG